MVDLKLIYFEGCPNVAQVRKRLQTAGYRFEEIDQDTLPEGHPCRNYSSPTILKGDRIIFGTLTGSGKPGCSLEAIPTAEEIAKKIGALEK